MTFWVKKVCIIHGEICLTSHNFLTFKPISKFLFVFSFKYIALSNSCIRYQYGPANKNSVALLTYVKDQTKTSFVDLMHFIVQSPHRCTQLIQCGQCDNRVILFQYTTESKKMKTVAIRTTVVPIRILIRTTVVPIRILIRTIAIINALSYGYSYRSWWLMCN